MIQATLFDDRYLSAGEASHELQVSIDTIRRWEKKGLVRATRTGKGDRRFDRHELERIKSKLSSASDRGFSVLQAESMSPYTVIELFAGAGGLSLGLENAGLNLSLAIEFDRNACATLKLNRPDWNVVESDVRDFDFNGYSADIVTGGFPCQAFSYAGHKLGFEDIRGTLFFEFARCVRETRPKLLVGENVRGLLKHDGGRTLATMVSVLQELGYAVQVKILRAHHFDVAQKRERLVIVGVRSDLNLAFEYPDERDYMISIREALKDVPKSAGAKYPESKRKVLELVPPGGYWRDLPEDLQRAFMGKSFYQGGGKTGMARRLDWDEPSLTLTCSPAQKQTERCHPVETRPLSVREYARIQSFPDSWDFCGSVGAQYKQIGNAVPVNLGFHIGTSLRKALDSQLINHHTLGGSEFQKTASIL